MSTNFETWFQDRFSEHSQEDKEAIRYWALIGWNAAVEHARRECEQMVKQGEKFALGPQQDCAWELFENIGELKEPR